MKFFPVQMLPRWLPSDAGWSGERYFPISMATTSVSTVRTKQLVHPCPAHFSGEQQSLLSASWSHRGMEWSEPLLITFVPDVMKTPFPSASHWSRNFSERNWEKLLLVWGDPEEVGPVAGHLRWTPDLFRTTFPPFFSSLLLDTAGNVAVQTTSTLLQDSRSFRMWGKEGPH
ncbi:hypothetical protein GWK47_051907 [Chionoecetes opilio]|uniref:Uncharacterized protein n=1 Tax=Chionoecetes opilio TaxID=41210 RepID=A0A8J5CT07_CHIOP|nr:hypothetical protein GWK47_051907 [Chionoecetes opilio]